MQRRVVVLPQPLGPSSEKNSPSITSKDSGPTVTSRENRLVSPWTASRTLGPATVLAQDLLVPAREVGRPVLVHLGEVQRRHVLEVRVLEGVVGHVCRELRLPVGRRIPEAARHLQLIV